MYSMYMFCRAGRVFDAVAENINSHGKSWEMPKWWGVSKAKGKYDAKLDVFDGWAVQTKKKLLGGGGTDIF